MTQKLIKVGSSTAAVIPKKYLDERGIHAGDEINIESDTEGFRIRLGSAKKSKLESLRWIDKFIQRHRNLFERLADK